MRARVARESASPSRTALPRAANGSCHYGNELHVGRAGCAYPLELGVSNWGLTELVEAVARVGRIELAAEALRQLSAMTSASGTDWALGIEARSRALLSDDDAAESLYREAIERLSHTRVRAEVARARLLYGEWLRRAGGGETLVTSSGSPARFVPMGADAFAERAGGELTATGERPGSAASTPTAG